MSNVITQQIPNAVTCCNLICGCTATYMAFSGNTEMAAAFILLGAVFDFFDGMTARLLKVSSPIGKELDSLADVVTFGVAPSAMVFHLLQTLMGQLSVVPFITFIMAAFSALRLAKFNLDTRQTTSFIGLPTPANALFWASLLVGAPELVERLSAAMPAACWLIPVFVFSLLLVAEVPMFALKFKNLTWADNKVKYIFLLGCAPMIICFGKACFAAIIAWYIVLSVVTQRHAK